MMAPMISASTSPGLRSTGGAGAAGGSPTSRRARSVAGWAAPEVLAIAVAVVCVAMPEVSATVTAPLCSSANFAMGTDYNDFSSGQSCYGLNPATGAGLWVYFVGAVLALASVPMLLRN